MNPGYYKLAGQLLFFWIRPNGGCEVLDCREKPYQLPESIRVDELKQYKLVPVPAEIYKFWLEVPVAKQEEYQDYCRNLREYVNHLPNDL